MSHWPLAKPNFGNTSDMAKIKTVFFSKWKYPELHSRALHQPVASSQNPRDLSEQELKKPQIRGFIYRGKCETIVCRGSAFCQRGSSCQGTPAVSPALHKQRLGSSKMPKANFHLPVPAPPAVQLHQQGAQAKFVYRGTWHLGAWASSL